MSQKGLAPILIILLIATAIGGYLIYSGKISLPQEQISQNSTADETLNWKTYQMDNVTLRYPSDYAVEFNDYIGIPMRDSEIAAAFIPPQQSTNMGEERLGRIVVEKLAVELEENIDTEGYIRNILFKNGFRTSDEIISLYKEKLGEVTVYRVLASGTYGVPPIGDYPNKTSNTFVRLGNNLYQFIFQHGGGPTPKPVYEYPNYSVYEQIISSIKSAESSKEVKLVDGDIVVINNGQETKITDWGHNSSPILSPDKTKVAYLSESAETLENKSVSSNPFLIRGSDNVWIINTDGTNPIQVTKHINFVGRDHLHWLDNDRLLYSDGTETMKVYTISKKSSQTVLGPDELRSTCMDACGYYADFFYNKDYSYLVYIETARGGVTTIRILNLKTLEETQLPEQQFGVNDESVTFSDDNKTVLFKAYRNGDSFEQSNLSGSINLVIKQVTLND